MSWSRCEAFTAEVNGRAYRVTRRAPTEMLAEERRRLHRPPEVAYTAASHLGVTTGDFTGFPNPAGKG